MFFSLFCMESCDKTRIRSKFSSLSITPLPGKSVTVHNHKCSFYHCDICELKKTRDLSTSFADGSSSDPQFLKIVCVS